MLDDDRRDQPADEPHPARADGRVQQLPQPRPAGQDHLHGRRHLRRTPRLGHRRRVVRERVPRLRVRVPGAEGSHRDAARDRRGRQEHVDRTGDDVPGLVLRTVPGQLRSQTAPGSAPAGVDRGRRRAAHPARRRPPRRRLQLRWQPGHVGAQARGAEDPLRGRRQGRGDDPQDVVARGVHPQFRGRGRGCRHQEPVGGAGRELARRTTWSARPSRSARRSRPTSIWGVAGSSPGVRTTPTPSRSRGWPAR